VMAAKRRNRTHPVFLDEKTYKVLIEATAKLTLLCGRLVSPSAVVRYAVAGPLATEIRVLDDLGEADRQEIRRLMDEAAVCRPVSEQQQQQSKETTTT
jgi:hypothetical protein